MLLSYDVTAHAHISEFFFVLNCINSDVMLYTCQEFRKGLLTAKILWVKYAFLWKESEICQTIGASLGALIFWQLILEKYEVFVDFFFKNNGKMMSILNLSLFFQLKPLSNELLELHMWYFVHRSFSYLHILYTDHSHTYTFYLRRYLCVSNQKYDDDANLWGSRHTQSSEEINFHKNKIR